MTVKALEKPFLSRDAFFQLFAELESLGFTRKSAKLTAIEMKNVSIAESWFAPRKKYGPEVIYRRFINKKEVLVLTTYSEKIGGAIGPDVGWVLVKDLVTNTFIFSFEIRRRSANFFRNIISQAKAHSEVAELWPACKFCNTSLGVIKLNDEVMHQREFICMQQSCVGYYEPTGVFVSTLSLSAENRRVFLGPYERYETYTAHNHAKGLDCVPRRKQRYYAKLGISYPQKKTDLYEGIDSPHDELGEYHEDHSE